MWFCVCIASNEVENIEVKEYLLSFKSTLYSNRYGQGLQRPNALA